MDIFNNQNKLKCDKCGEIIISDYRMAGHIVCGGTFKKYVE